MAEDQTGRGLTMKYFHAPTGRQDAIRVRASAAGSVLSLRPRALCPLLRLQAGPPRHGLPGHLPHGCPAVGNARVFKIISNFCHHVIFEDSDTAFCKKGYVFKETAELWDGLFPGVCFPRQTAE